mgnify:CR=1 FL=1
MTTKTKDKTFGLNYKREFYIKVEGKQLRVNDYGDKLHSLIDDLGWEYQRMGRCGREIYDEIQQLLGGIDEDEVYMEID